MLNFIHRNHRLKIRSWGLLFFIFIITQNWQVMPAASKPGTDFHNFLPLLKINKKTTRVSISTNGVQGNLESEAPVISADGRYVAFFTQADNLFDDDHNYAADVLVHDRLTGLTTLVSKSTEGTQGNDFSSFPSISADGRFISFHSWATNLVYNPGSAHGEIFVHDLETGETTQASLPSGGGDPNNSSGFWNSISPDGYYVAFPSRASNLVPDDNNGVLDVFLHDRHLGITTRVSEAAGGIEGNDVSYRPHVSQFGRQVAFVSSATNLVSGDTNESDDIFVLDQDSDQLTRVSVSSQGNEGNGNSWYPFISNDGRYVAFASIADNLVDDDTNGTWDVFLHDRYFGQTFRISMAADESEGNGPSINPTFAADACSIVFESDADNLVSNDINGKTDIFLYDCRSRQTTLISVDTAGTQGNDISWRSLISADGLNVAFESEASNLVNGDTNFQADIFVHEMGK